MRTEWVTGRTVRIKDGWQDAGKRGMILCKPIRVGQIWIAVLWDGEQDPDWHKARGLELVIVRKHRDQTKAKRLADTAARMLAASLERRAPATSRRRGDVWRRQQTA